MNVFDNMPASIEAVVVTKEDIIRLKKAIQELKEQKGTGNALVDICYNALYKREITGIEKAIEILKIKLPEDDNSEKDM